MKLDKQELKQVVEKAIGKSNGSSSSNIFYNSLTAASQDQSASGEKPYSIKITVVGVQGVCTAGHKIGQEYIIKGDKTPEGICLAAFSGLLPFITAIQYGAEFPWEEKGTIRLGCCDPDNNVQFKIDVLR